MSQVGNKNIDNASGQVVRLDMQNTVQAVATNNFGQRNDAGTILPCEFLADDTTNKLLIRQSTGGDQANPNPSSGTINIELGEQGEFSVEISDIIGKSIYNNIIKTNTNIDINGLDTGVYFVTISNENKSNTTKLIVE